MNLKEYNNLQTRIIKKYQLLADMERFIVVCRLFSEYRGQAAGYTTTKKLITIVRNNSWQKKGFCGKIYLVE